MANRAKPTANGPMIPKLGSPMATAYTTDTSTNVMIVSQPNSMPEMHQTTSLAYQSWQSWNLMCYSLAISVRRNGMHKGIQAMLVPDRS